MSVCPLHYAHDRLDDNARDRSRRCGCRSHFSATTRKNRQITVFTDPTPLRAGPVDVSILVQDTSTGGAILDDADYDQRAAPLGRSSFAAHYRATNAAASNKLFQVAKFDLPHAGQWEFTMDVQGAEETARLHFDAAVAMSRCRRGKRYGLGFVGLSWSSPFSPCFSSVALHAQVAILT